MSQKEDTRLYFVKAHSSQSVTVFAGIRDSPLFKGVIAVCASLLLTHTGPAQGVANVAVGENHSLFLKQDGTVWATGLNDTGQVGDGSGTNRNTTVLIMTGVSQIASGLSHTLLLKADGNVWSVGNDFQGGLGNDNVYAAHHAPVWVMEEVKGIAAGAYHSLFLKTNGTVWACGSNDYGQLGNGTSTEAPVPVQVETTNDVYLDNVAEVSAGSRHSLFVKNDGTLWAAGANGEGQFGNGTSNGSAFATQVLDGNTNLPVTNTKAVSAGGDFSLWLKNDNTVWATGYNGSGQLGDGTTDNRHSPVPIMPGRTFSRISAGNNHSLFVQSDSTVWAVGYNFDGQLGNGTTSWDPVTVPVAVGNHVVEARAGWTHSLFVRTDGVYGCGNNYLGQLGNGILHDPDLHPTPIKIFVCSKYRRFTGATGAGVDSLILKNDGTAWGMGTSYGSSPIMTGPGDLVSVTQGTYTSSNINSGVTAQMRTALKADGTVWRWNNTTPATAIPGLSGVVSIADSPSSTAFPVLRANGTVNMVSSFYGYNNYAITGVSFTEYYHTFTLDNIAQISSSGTSHVALQNDGHVWAWGDNSHGELGDGTTTSRDEAARVLDSYYYPLTDVAAVTSGIASHYALKTDGTVWVWGYGLLGNGALATRPTAVQVNGLTGVVAVSANGYNTFALKSDGTVVAWGLNYNGQLGIGSTLHKLVPTPIPNLTGVIEVTSCGNSTFFRLADGRVFACGSNSNYQLGVGNSSTANRLTPVLVNGY